MKLSKWAVVIVLALVAAACSKEKETPKGYKYTVARKGDGKIAKFGQYILMDFMFKDGKDSVWNDSRKQEIPMYIPVRDTFGIKQEEGLDEILRLLSKGDSIVMKLKAKVLFEKSFRQPLPPNIDANSDFTFFITVKDILDSTQFAKASEEIRTKQMEKMRTAQAEQLAKDTVIIDNYLKEKNIVTKKTASGLRYVVVKPGKGENAKPGQTASIAYAGYLLDGKCFDTSIEKVAKDNGMYVEGRQYTPYPVQIATGSVIQGWDEAIQLMNKGSKIKVYIPSVLAYGPSGSGPVIAPNSVLTFDMELTDLK